MALKYIIELNNSSVLISALILFFKSSLIIIDICGFCQALDTFNTAIVSPIYYAMFTSFTILASAIMFKVYMIALSCYNVKVI